MKKICFSLALFGLVGCGTIQSVSVSSILPDNKNIISAEETVTGYFMLYIPDIIIADKLRKQCPNGEINGIQSKLTLRNFLIFQFYSLHADAYCSRI